MTAGIRSDFGDYLQLIPSSTGLHIAAYARTASLGDIEAIASRALDLGVAIRPFPLEGTPQAGIMLGYGAIETARIAEGLRRLRSCFDEHVSRRSKAA